MCIFVNFLIFKPQRTTLQGLSLQTWLNTHTPPHPHPLVRNPPSVPCSIISFFIPRHHTQTWHHSHSCLTPLSFPPRKKPWFCGSLSIVSTELGLLFMAGASNTWLDIALSDMSSLLPGEAPNLLSSQYIFASIISWWSGRRCHRSLISRLLLQKSYFLFQLKASSRLI